MASSSHFDFLDSLAQPAVLWDADGRVCHWSPRAAVLLGWPADATLGKAAADLPFLTESNRMVFATSLRGEAAAAGLSLTVTRQDGSTVAVVWQHSARQAPDGVRLGTLSLVREDDQSHGSDKLVYRSLFESSPGLFVVLDPHDYRILAVSDSYLALTMRTRDELLGRIFFEAFPDDPANPEARGTANLLASFARVKATLAKDVMDIVKHPILNPAGQLEDRYWAPLNSPVLDAGGKLQLLIHSTEDVTEFVQKNSLQESSDRSEVSVMIRTRELKQLNDRLRESQQRLQAIFNGASLGIAATDLEGYFTDANAAYCSMMGYTLDELKQLNVLDLTHADERGRSLELREELKRGDRPDFVYEKRYLTKPGDVVWCRISASVLRDAQGRITNLIAITEDISQQRHSEAELRKIRTLERIGGTIAKVGGWVVDYLGDGARHVQWSKELFELFEIPGGTPPPVDALLELFTPISRQQFRRALFDCEFQGVPFDLELSLSSFKGTPRWIRIAGEPEFTADGKVARTLGAVQDISRQKAEQLRNQQLSSQLFSTLESMSDAFYMLDRDGRVLYLNSGAERLLHLNRDDTIGRVIWERVPAFKQSPAYAGFMRALQTRETYHEEYYSELLQNWISISAYPSAEGLAVYFRSITAEKQLQARIAESEERLKHIAQAALDVVWEIDLHNRTIWFNDGLKNKYGYDLENQALDLSYWREKMHPDDAADSLPRMWAMLDDTTDTTWSNRYRFRAANGNYVHFEDRGYVVRDAKGKAMRVLGGSTDVTERLAMEEQLLQSQRLDSIGQLTGGIAHDFNNLLTVILGNVQLLHEELNRLPELQHLSRIIEVAATRGADLTRHLLAFSRKQALQPVSIDLNQLITHLRGMLARTLGENVVVRYKPQPELWPAFIDPNQLEVAMLNLCINSRDAMPGGGVVTIETANVVIGEIVALKNSDVQPGDYVVITISDTGSGIPPEIIDHVFEPFFTTKEKGKGTGLGLSTVFGFIKQSDGHIHIYSEVGKGTAVKIYLPRSHEDVEATKPMPRTVETVGGSETILLVEDNELVRKFGHDLLKALGYTVLAASDAKEALALLRQTTGIDLLFTDVIMPGMGGHELAKAARAVRPDLKVLYASGYTEDSIIHNGKLDKGVHLLEKPYNKSGLASKIREVLDGDVVRA